MVRVSARPEDYVVCRVQRDTPTGPALGLINENPLLPRLTRADGTRIVPPRAYRFDVPSPDAGDPFGLTEMIGTRGASSETHKLKIGRRNAHPHGWLVTVDGFTDVPICAYIDGVPVSEFTFQHYGEADEFFDNPTMYGAPLDQVVYVNVGGNVALEKPYQFLPSPKFFLNLQSGADGNAYYEGAATPLHFDVGGRQGGGAAGDHGEDLEHVAVMWDQKEYRKIELNVGNRARVHRITGYSYQRRGWQAAAVAPFLNTFGTSFTGIERPLGRKYDKIEIFDIDNILLDGGGVMLPNLDKSSVLASFGTPNQSLVFFEIGNGFYTGNETDPAAGPSAQDPQQFRNQRGCIAVTDSVSGFCIAIVAKLIDQPWPFDGCKTPNTLQLLFPCFNWFDSYTHPQLLDYLGPYFQLNTYDNSFRQAGWIGASFLLYVGHRSHLQAALENIRDTALLDAPTPTPPTAVTDGTEWPPGTPPGTITVDYFDDTATVREESAGEVDICNMALANLAQTTQIESLNPLEDGDTTAALCARYYAKTRDSLLQRRDWTFARKRTTLTVLGDSPTSAWLFCFVAPDDMLALRGVHLEGSADDKHPEEAVIELVNGTRAILTNAPTGSWCRYTARVTSPNQFPPLFITALSWFLSAQLAGPLTGDVSRIQFCQQMAMQALAEAVVSDANQDRLDIHRSHHPEFLRGRGLPSWGVRRRWW